MLKKILYWPIALLNILCCSGFLISGYSYIIPPAEHPTLALASYTFPFFAMGVLFFMAFWLFVKWKYAIISILSLIICAAPMQKYAPFTGPDEDTDGALKIISYNVHCFAAPDVFSDTITMGNILNYLDHSDADIICLQESYVSPERKDEFVSNYKYVEVVEDPSIGIGLTCLSKYPIVKTERIEYDSKHNLSACFHVRYKDETIRVINNHFESINITQDDKEGFKSYVKKALEDDNDGLEGSKRIAGHIRDATIIRQKQAEAVAKFIGRNPKNTILLGDFNDTPLSYTHHVIEEKLTDCYAERGWLTGFSYVNHGMFVRIDHTFCSDDFKTVKCYVDNSVDYSDHHPIITYLKRAE